MTPTDISQRRPPLLRRVAVFCFRWLYRVVGLSIILCASLVLVAQTDWFRDRMRDVIVEQLDGVLEGTLTFDAIRLDIWNGITVDHPVLYAHGTTLLDARRLSVMYDLAPLAKNIVAVSRLRLEHPHIAVLRGATDSVWNVSKIVKPSVDTTTSAPPNLHIVVRWLAITNGTVLINDRTKSWGPPDRFDPTHLHLEDVNLHASARLSLRVQDFAFAVNRFSYRNPTAPVEVRMMRLAARVTPSGLDIPHLRIRTAESDIAARMSAPGLNIFDGLHDSSLRITPLRGVISADRFWAQDLHYFVPDVDILDAYRFDGSVIYTGRSVTVTEMDIRAERTKLTGSVTVDNLDGAKPLYLDVSLTDSWAQYRDVRHRLRFVPLPKLEFLGTTVLRHVHMKGHPEDSLAFDIDGRDRVGSIRGTATLYLRSTFGYRGSLDITKGAIEVLTGDSTVVTDLNGHVNVDGAGTSFPDVRGEVYLRLDASSIAGRQLRSAYVHLRADGQGLVDVDSMFVDVTPFVRDSTNEVLATGITQTLTAEGAVSFAAPHNPVYDVDVISRALDLSRLLQDASFPNRVTASVSVRGRGFRPDSLNATVQAAVREFTMSDRALLPFRLNASLIRGLATKRVINLVASRWANQQPFLEASIEGSFLLTDAITAAAATAAQTIAIIRRDSRHVTADTTRPIPLDTTLGLVDASFSLKASDLSLVNIILDDITLDGALTLSGSLKAGLHASSVMASVDANTLAVRTDSLEVLSDPFVASCVVELTDMAGSPTLARSKLDWTVDSTVSVNALTVLRPSVHVDLVDGVGIARVNGIVGRQSIVLAGKLGLYRNESTFTVDTLVATLDASRNLVWAADPGGTCSVMDKSMTISGLSLQRTWAERIRIDGSFSAEAFRDVTISVTQFPLADIRTLADAGEESPLALLGGMVTEANARITGSWRNPEISLTLKATDVSYNGEAIGQHEMTLQHKDKTISGTATVVNPAFRESIEALSIDIVQVPIDCGFVDITDRLVPNRPVDVRLNANKLSLAAIEPFLPAVERVRGTADARVTISGTTPSNIDFSGQGRFDKASFIASSTGLSYYGNGSMRLVGSDLLFDTIMVYNTQRDYRKGKAFVSGLVHFQGLAVDSIDFRLQSQGLQVLNRASQTRSPDVFGDLVIASGKQPLHFYGKLTEPHLDGELVIEAGQIVFPKERSTTKRRLSSFTRMDGSDSLAVTYGGIRDYVRAPLLEKLLGKTDTVNSADRLIPISDTAMRLRTNGASVGSNGAVVPKGGFADILQYDLDVFINGRFQIDMVLGATELLRADLALVDPRVPLQVGGSLGSGLKVIGQMRVKKGESTYQFFRTFEASGLLNFNTGEMTNPALDLVATYRDSRIINDRRETFRVDILIKGTKEKPRTDFRIFRNDEEITGKDTAQIRGDALMLIIVGRTQEELFNATGQSNVLQEVNSAASAAATQLLGDVLSGIGNVKTQLDLGADLNTSRISISGEVLGGVQYRVSGTVADISANNTFTVTLPLSVLANADALQYFLLDFSRTINQNGNITRQQRDWEIKLGVRLP